jgi:hypothetical protein
VIGLVTIPRIEEEPRPSLVVVPILYDVADVTSRGAPPDRAENIDPRNPDIERRSGPEPTRLPSIPIIVGMDEERGIETIPPTTLMEMRGAVLPLVVTSTGIGRRVTTESPEALARARAESLLTSWLASLAQPGPPSSGPLSLSEGGVSLAIPWQGFLPADRSDRVWRRERCGGGDREADKAGEARARRAQCD